jgi:hypothetical protein
LKTGDRRDPSGRERGRGGEESSLPVSHAFVVQFSGDSHPSEHLLRGRIEHIESGWSQRFASIEELQSFVERALTMKGREE